MKNQNQKGISSLIGIVIVVILAILVVGGVLAYQYWWAPEEEEVKSPETVSINIFIDVGSFDLTNKTFEGKTQVEEEKIKVLTTDSTKFYITAEPSWEKEYFTFSEFYSLVRDDPHWPFHIKGILENEGIVKANEVYTIAQ